jgi:hypothetical protein
MFLLWDFAWEEVQIEGMWKMMINWHYENIQVKTKIVTKVNGFMNFTFLQIMCIMKFEIMIPNMSICVFVAIVQIHCCITTNYWQTKFFDQLSCNVFVWKIFLFYKSFFCVCWSFLVVDTSKSRKWKGF